jgi:Phospholipase_D-nuclease N-terminal
VPKLSERKIIMEWTFGTLLWSMLVFFFWFMFIWMFVAIFADILRRDLSGWAKAGWIVLIVVLPFLGILIYLIARPKTAAQYGPMIGEPYREGAPAAPRPTRSPRRPSCTIRAGSRPRSSIG